MWRKLNGIVLLALALHVWADPAPIAADTEANVIRCWDSTHPLGLACDKKDIQLSAGQGAQASLANAILIYAPASNTANINLEVGLSGEVAPWACLTSPVQACSASPLWFTLSPGVSTTVSVGIYDTVKGAAGIYDGALTTKWNGNQGPSLPLHVKIVPDPSEWNVRMNALPGVLFTPAPDREDIPISVLQPAAFNLADVLDRLRIILALAGEEPQGWETITKPFLDSSLQAVEQANEAVKEIKRLNSNAASDRVSLIKTQLGKAKATAGIDQGRNSEYRAQEDAVNKELGKLLDHLDYVAILVGSLPSLHLQAGQIALGAAQIQRASQQQFLAQKSDALRQRAIAVAEFLKRLQNGEQVSLLDPQDLKKLSAPTCTLGKPIDCVKAKLSEADRHAGWAGNIYKERLQSPPAELASLKTGIETLPGQMDVLSHLEDGFNAATVAGTTTSYLKGIDAIAQGEKYLAAANAAPLKVAYLEGAGLAQQLDAILTTLRNSVLDAHKAGENYVAKGEQLVKKLPDFPSVSVWNESGSVQSGVRAAILLAQTLGDTTLRERAYNATNSMENYRKDLRQEFEAKLNEAAAAFQEAKQLFQERVTNPCQTPFVSGCLSISEQLNKVEQAQTKLENVAETILQKLQLTTPEDLPKDLGIKGSADLGSGEVRSFRTGTVEPEKRRLENLNQDTTNRANNLLEEAKAGAGASEAQEVSILTRLPLARRALIDAEAAEELFSIAGNQGAKVAAAEGIGGRAQQTISKLEVEEKLLRGAIADALAQADDLRKKAAKPGLQLLAAQDFLRQAETSAITASADAQRLGDGGVQNQVDGTLVNIRGESGIVATDILEAKGKAQQAMKAGYGYMRQGDEKKLFDQRLVNYQEGLSEFVAGLAQQERLGDDTSIANTKAVIQSTEKEIAKTEAKRYGTLQEWDVKLRALRVAASSVRQASPAFPGTYFAVARTIREIRETSGSYSEALGTNGTVDELATELSDLKDLSSQTLRLLEIYVAVSLVMTAGGGSWATRNYMKSRRYSQDHSIEQRLFH